MEQPAILMNEIPQKHSGRKILIKLEDVSKIYPVGNGRVNALKNVSLEIRQGELMSIVGPSGSGKSTLLHILGLLSRPSQGRVIFEDEEIQKLSDRRISFLRSRRIGFVFQAFHLLGAITGAENVELPLIYQRLSPHERRQRALRSLEVVGLSHRSNHYPRQLSGGESQRVAIARALVSHPSVVLADEPTGNLDTQTGIEIMKVLKGLRAQGMTVIVVTHDASIAAQTERVLYLHDGAIVREKS